jgi:hypothetical protein
MAAQQHLEHIHHKNWSKVITHETIANNQINAIEVQPLFQPPSITSPLSPFTSALPNHVLALPLDLT